MSRRGIRGSAPLVAVALVLLLLPAAWGDRRARKIKQPPPTCNITVMVLKPDGTPLQKAAVVFQPLSTENKPWGNMELKTNRTGKVNLNLIPIGQKLLLQVIANGYNTYGKVYELPDATKDITVKMQYPKQQYSIYPKDAARKRP